MARSPEFPVAPQNLQTPVPVDLLLDPSLNSTMAFKVQESAKARTQNNLVLPHPESRILYIYFILLHLS